MAGGKITGSINLPSGVSASIFRAMFILMPLIPKVGVIGLSLNLTVALKFLCNPESMNCLSGLIRNSKVLEALHSKLCELEKAL